MGVKLIPFLWGFAEATLFFIVPDVWLTVLARDRLRPGIKAALFALAGALLGGMLMYGWGTVNPEAAFQTLEKIPAINPALIDSAVADMKAEGTGAVLKAPLKGVPYKIYAVQAARQNIPFLQFALITIPARLIRFLAVTVLVHYALKLGLGKKSARTRTLALIAGWSAFYAFYFIRMG